jgi:hypothetical protein
MKPLLLVLFCAAALARAAAPAAPDDLRMAVEMLRSDLNTAKIETLNGVLRLTGPEADAFWPIYRAYEKELAALGDRKIALIREFGGHHVAGTLDDGKAATLARDWLRLQEDRVALWKKYHRKLGRAVSPMRAAQFLQVEHQMALFVDLNLAAEMPAVGAKP